MENSGIKMENITMDFSGNLALSDVDIYIKKGSIHAIVGENGAGKSTLMNILSGVLTPTSGRMSVDGKKSNFAGLKEATENKIGMVYQHFMLVHQLKVWQNIILGCEPNIKMGWIDKKSAYEKIEEACKDYGITLELEQTVGNLTVGQQQRVEIIKVLYKKAEYIILDEPTAVLTPKEVEHLISSIKELQKQGKTIIFISHKLEEVMNVADEISVLRRGKFIGTVKASETTTKQLVTMMVGKEISFDEKPLETKKGDIVVKIDNICTVAGGFGCSLKNLSFSCKKAEIYGIAGVDGNGQSELIESIMGLRKIKSGKINLLGKDFANSTTQKIRSEGVACIPPDRHSQGIVLDNTIAQNAVMGFENNRQFKSFACFLSPKKIQKAAEKMAQNYNVSYTSTQQKIRFLSGGNQQKVILARECGITDKEIIIAANPTRGLDVGAISFVYSVLEDLKKQGKCIILISTELTEILRLSDNIGVLFDGQIMGELKNENVNLDELGAMMLGVKRGVK